MTETATTRPPSGGQPILKPALHHFGIATTRVEEMAEWYALVLGMETTLSSEVPIKSRYISNDGAHHRGGFFQAPGIDEDPDKLKHARIQHLAFEYDSLEDMLVTWERLAGLGIHPVKSTDHGPSWAIYYKDPDNNTVELLADAYGDYVLSMKHMREDPQMISNPPGEECEPEKLLAALRAGASLAELRERSMAGEFRPAQPYGPMASQ